MGEHLVHTYALAGRVALNVQADRVALTLDAAIPCGLLVNELLSNAFKHAFPGGRRGEVTVEHDRGTAFTVRLASPAEPTQQPAPEAT